MNLEKEKIAEASLQSFAIMSALKVALGDRFDGFYVKLKETKQDAIVKTAVHAEGYGFAEVDSLW